MRQSRTCSPDMPANCPSVSTVHFFDSSPCRAFKAEVTQITGAVGQKLTDISPKGADSYFCSCQCCIMEHNVYQSINFPQISLCSTGKTHMMLLIIAEMSVFWGGSSITDTCRSDNLLQRSIVMKRCPDRNANISFQKKGKM